MAKDQRANVDDLRCTRPIGWFSVLAHRQLSNALWPLVIACVFLTVVRMSRSLMTEFGDPFGASNIGAQVPFFMMMYLTGCMIIATPLIIRSISGGFMMAGPQSIPGPGGLAKGLIGTKRSRARFGYRSNAEMTGAGIRQAGSATVSMIQGVADRAKRLN